MFGVPPILQTLAVINEASASDAGKAAAADPPGKKPEKDAGKQAVQGC